MSSLPYCSPNVLKLNVPNFALKNLIFYSSAEVDLKLSLRCRIVALSPENTPQSRNVLKYLQSMYTLHLCFHLFQFAAY